MAKELGGSVHMERTSIDGYDFAVLRDPESNVFGMIAPFTFDAAAAPART